MNSKRKSSIVISILLSILLIGTLLPNTIMAQETVSGTQDPETTGVWLFSAGENEPAEAPTSQIIKAAVDYDILDYIGDSAEEVYEFGSGLVEPTPGQEDTTLTEVVKGLSAIDDFGLLANADDDAANFDTGSGGYLIGGFDRADPHVIVSDGIVATGELGPSGAANATAAEDAISGYEIFIFEDAELSGMIVTLNNSLGLSITFTIEDLQVNPPTRYGADDTLIAVDLDSLPGFDSEVDFVETIRIQDDDITSPSEFGDTTLEIDAVATRLSTKKPKFGSIGDTVWLDENRNGIQDGGEIGVSGVTVTLVGVGPTITIGNGYYLFDNLPADTYTVQVQVPSGFEATTVTSYLIDLGIGEDYLDADFGIAPRLVLPGSISGIKFEDCNENGVQDPGEPGIEGATIRLESPIDSPVAETTTNSDGYYEFLDLPPGDYLVIQIDLPGYYSTTPNEVEVTLDPGGHEEVNFGDARYSRIYGVKFEDLNENGDLNINEPGIENAIIKLLNSTGHEVATTTTNGTGHYDFTNLMPGDYTVVHEDLEGYFNTTPNEVPVTLGPCQEINVDFGDARESCGDICRCCWKCIICCAEKSTGRVRELFEEFIVRINEQSTVFSEVYTISSIEDACDLLSDYGDWKQKAIKELLICWLNWANCAIRMNQMVDTDCDGDPDMTFSEAMTIVEEILSNPGSTWEELRHAYYICYYINTCN